MAINATALVSLSEIFRQVLAANLNMNASNCIDTCRVFEYSWGRWRQSEFACERNLLTIALLCSGKAASLDGTCAAPYDVIIASDLVYSAVGARLLAQSIVDNLKRGGVFLLVCTRRAVFFGTPHPSLMCLIS
jgi:hypothetical protein